MSDTRFLTLKKELFDKFFGFLNDMQRTAVYTTEGPLLVLAGAGSGKTTVIVNRIANIVRFGKSSSSQYVPEDAESLIPEMERVLKTGTSEEVGRLLDRFAIEPADGSRVLCITFTNKAANEFKERLRSVLGSRSDSLWAGTFHSVCVRFLRRHIHKIGYKNDFTIYDADDSKKLITEVLKELGVAESVIPPRSAMSAISKAKENGLTPDDERILAGKDVRLNKLCDVYENYQKRLVNANALDFDDIIMLANRLFETVPEVLEAYREQFDYILVDEYQDTNPSQSRLVALLSGKKRNVCVVGDDDQSIYAFRGATVDNILCFDEEYSGCKTVRLEQNYRSTGNILAAANAVISHNSLRKGKNLWTEASEGEKIHVKRLFTQQEEAAYIADIIAAQVAKGAKYSDFAILYRVNALSNAVETGLVKRKIPYRVFGGIKFFERREVKDILAYLSVIVNPADAVRLKRIINVPKRSIGDTTIQKLSDIALRDNSSIYEVARSSGDYPELTRVSPKLIAFVSDIENMREFAEHNSVSDTVSYVIKHSGYQAYLKAEDDGEDREQNVLELVSSAKLFEETAETPTLAEFLNELSLVSDVDDYDGESDSVVLMTVHSAKGLEFPVVFIPGFEEGLFPSSKSLTDGDEGLEEERRLAYVAITRAKNELYLLHTASRMLYGRTETRQSSRFALEIPESVCEKERVRDKNGNTAAPVSAYSVHHSESRNNFLSSINRAQKPTSSAAEVIAPGTRVKHGIFGQGEILSATPMGGDVLYEIRFDNGSVKRLMGNFAHLTKI